jgi:hypothetical protein
MADSNAESTRPATWEDVKLVARLLDAAGAKWILIGGYAIAAHGFVRYSEDVDILVEPSRENTKRWIAALAGLPDGATKELAGQDDLFPGHQRHILRQTRRARNPVTRRRSTGVSGRGTGTGTRTRTCTGGKGLPLAATKPSIAGWRRRRRR